MSGDPVWLKAAASWREMLLETGEQLIIVANLIRDYPKAGVLTEEDEAAVAHTLEMLQRSADAVTEFALDQYDHGL